MNIAADGTATSDPFTPTQAGRYWWLATFNGDANNKVVSSTCGQGQSAADKVSPSIVTTATATATLPAATVSDTATLTGVTATAGGTIVFSLFGRSPTAACTGTPVFTATPNAVKGPGVYGPASTTVNAAGTYWWMATYSGDADNLAVSPACGDEHSVVDPAPAPSAGRTSRSSVAASRKPSTLHWLCPVWDLRPSSACQ